MLSALKPFVDKKFSPIIVRIFGDVHPDTITLVGGIVPVVFFIAVVFHYYAFALAVYLLLAVDVVDGMIARHKNKETKFGGFLDSTIDRFSDSLLLTSFGFAKIVRWEIIIPLLICTFLISYVRTRTELALHNGTKATVGFIERSERLVFLFFALLLYVLYPKKIYASLNSLEILLSILLVLSFITVLQRIHFAKKVL